MREAGFSPNAMQEAYSDEYLLEKVVSLIRELGHYPVYGEFRMKSRQDRSFPNADTFRRLGDKPQLVARAARYCDERSGYDDVARICLPVAAQATWEQKETKREAVELGYVYLLKFGRHHKIGRSNSAGRRERELSIQLPEKARLVHAIKTDDPVGIELYWHRRFESRRGNGEWFDLTAEDIAAFRRRKFM